MQLVNISNIKLNNDIFSSKSLSIHRRILVKNLLTLLYETHPMLNWFDDGLNLQVTDDGGFGEEGQDTSGEPLLGEDEQNGWMEQTLSAAGLAEDDDDAEEDDDDDEQDDDDDVHGARGAYGQHLRRDSDSDSEEDLERGYVHISVGSREERRVVQSTFDRQNRTEQNGTDRQTEADRTPVFIHSHYSP